jgi:hypothetical protein
LRQKELPHLLEHLLFSGIDEMGEGGLEERLQALAASGTPTPAAPTPLSSSRPRAQPAQGPRPAAGGDRDTRIDAKALAAKRIIEREGGHTATCSAGSTARISATRQRPTGHRAGAEMPGALQPRRHDPGAGTGLRDRWYAANNMTLIVVGGLDRLLPAYLERTFGELPATEPKRRNLPHAQQAEQRRDLTRGWLGDSVKLHWLFIEPVLDNDHEATLDLLSRYLDWALYDQLRLRNGLSYGPSAQRESFGDTGLLSLNADLERDDIDKAVKVMQALFDHLRKEGLDPTPSPASRTPAPPGKLECPGQQRLGRLLLGCAERLYRRALRQPGAQAAPGQPGAGQRGAAALLKEPGYLRIEKPLLAMTNCTGWSR